MTHSDTVGPIRAIIERSLARQTDPPAEVQLDHGGSLMFRRIQRYGTDVLFCAAFLPEELLFVDRRLTDRLGLTPRQALVARLLALRLTNQEIASQLGISENTARHHTETVLLRLGAADRYEVRRVLRDVAMMLLTARPGG